MWKRSKKEDVGMSSSEAEVEEAVEFAVHLFERKLLYFMFHGDTLSLKQKRKRIFRKI